MLNTIRKFPARPLNPDERALVSEWLAAAGDVPLAFVSGRRSDDAAIQNRIVVITEPTEPPAHLIHASPGRDIWMVFSRRSGRAVRVKRYRDLRAALNSIRAVLAHGEPADQPDAAGSR